MKGSEWIKEALEETLGKPQSSVHLAGLKGSSKPLLALLLQQALNRPVAVIVRRAEEVAGYIADLRLFASGLDRVSIGSLPDPLEAGPTKVSRRLAAPGQQVSTELLGIKALIDPEKAGPIWVLSLPSLLWRPPGSAWWKEHVLTIRKGQTLHREGWPAFLEANEYRRATLVQELGEFAIRGFVLDLFPPFMPEPVRLECEGDRVEDIRPFDPDTQRSTGHQEECRIFPIRIAEAVDSPPAVERLPKSTIVLLDHYSTMEDEIRGNDLHDRLTSFSKIMLDPLLLTEGTQRGSILQWRCRDLLGLRQAIEVHRMRLPSAGTSSDPLQPLVDLLAPKAVANTRTILTASDDTRLKRLRQALIRNSIPHRECSSFAETMDGPSSVFLLPGQPSEGFHLDEWGLSIIPDTVIYGRADRRMVRRQPQPQQPDLLLADLRPGDYVVHADYGVGRFVGASQLAMRGSDGQFLKIEYAEDGMIYLPVDRIGLLEKYMGADGIQPKLDRLGSTHWQRSKQKAKEDIKALAKELAALYARRESRPGHAFAPPDDYLREFEATFPHQETADQQEAIEAVYADLARNRPMDRLVCGEVGYGKTEVALRSAFLVGMSGKQVAILVPTTLLAYQHFETFSKRLEIYPLKVRMLSRFVPPSEQKTAVREILNGAVDIVIGTHRLLSRDVQFADLGLLVVDEEQRFGVTHKEKIKKLREQVDVLTLTATPIPRSLHMALLGIRDLSTIATPPQERKDILTFVAPLDDGLIRNAIEEEMERGGQVFFVHPRIRGLGAMEEYLHRLIPRARISTAHGRMDESELERVMIDFARKEIDILLCTSIIEAGLDLPNANTIIIAEADRFGLAQLHQLRGRVGRSGTQAHAYLIVPEKEITPEAVKRLEAVQESGLGSGMDLAKRDLEIRGGGDFLGKHQSGHVARVGFHMYLSLIEEAVKEMKGETVRAPIDPEIRLPHRGSLPESYVGDVPLRIYFYRKCARAGDAEALNAIRDELRDRFGTIPETAADFFAELAIRLELKRLGIERLSLRKNALTLTFSKESPVLPDRLVAFVGLRRTEFKLAPPMDLLTWLPTTGKPHPSIRTVLQLLITDLLNPSGK